MKTYDNCPLKRAIQHVLWKNIPVQKRILALSSPNFEQEYIEALPNRKELTLVNFEPKLSFDCIQQNSLIGAFDMMLYKNQIPTFIDADFCRTIKSCGDDLIYLYNKCKKLNKDIIISFTFSIRGTGVLYTLKWLHENFNVNVNNYVGLPILEEHYGYRQFCNKYGDCIHYRDSGDQMVTGIIKIKNNESNL